MALASTLPLISLALPDDRSFAASTATSNAMNPTIHSTPTSSGRTRSSSLLHKTVISRMRPLPLQYVFSMWHTRSSVTSNPTTSTTQLAESIPDIAAFYRAFNNFPWDILHPKDGVHFFRSGVKPLWEDVSNLDGGCWVLKVRNGERALRTWEELCLLVCGGELQAAVARAMYVERDHILGISYSPRLYYTHISIWTKYGDNLTSIKALQRTAILRLSETLRPTSEMDYYYKKHSSHQGWQEAVEEVVRRGGR